MRRNRERRPEIKEKLDQADRRFREARGRLRWRVDEAKIPLTVQERHGISQLKGQVLIISYSDSLQQRIKDVLVSENYRCDIAERSSIAVGMLKMAKYDMIIVDFTRFRRSNIFSFVRRFQPHVKIISIVSDERRARDLMRYGSYSFLVGRNFDTEQLRTCLVSSLRMKHRVCGLQARGERCNRSCVNSYQTEEDFMDVGEEFPEPEMEPDNRYNPFPSE